MTENWTARFEQATKDVTALSEAPDIPTKLRLYALFKQWRGIREGGAGSVESQLLYPTAVYSFEQLGFQLQRLR
jgi:hypothetical protein